MQTTGTRRENSHDSKLNLLEALSNYIIDEIDVDKSEIERFLSILIKKLQRKNSNFSTGFQEINNFINDVRSNHNMEDILEREISSSNYSQSTISDDANIWESAVFDRYASDIDDSNNKNSRTKVLGLPRIKDIFSRRNNFNEDEKMKLVLNRNERDQVEITEQSIRPNMRNCADWDECKENLENLNTLIGNDEHEMKWKQIARIKSIDNGISKIEENKPAMSRKYPTKRRRWTLNNKSIEIQSNLLHKHTIRVYPKRPHTTSHIDHRIDKNDSSKHSYNDESSEDIIQLYNKVTDLILKKYRRLSRSSIKEIQSFLENKSHLKKDLNSFEASTIITSEMPCWAIKGLMNETRGTTIDVFCTILNRMTDYIINTRGKFVKEDINVFMRVLNQKMIEQGTCWRRNSLPRIQRNKSSNYKNIIQNGEGSMTVEPVKSEIDYD